MSDYTRDNEFSFMDETVEKICKSLIEEPHVWVFRGLTFYSSRSAVKIEYWSSNPALIWSGTDTARIFSSQQGSRIEQAMKIAQRSQASELQKKVIQSVVQNESETHTGDYHIWNRIKKFMQY